MKEIKFKGYHHQYNRIVNVNYINLDTREVDYDGNLSEPVSMDNIDLMRHVGIKDKDGKDVCRGHYITIRTPLRREQTHTGDNIPNGSYTEPMEAGIDPIEYEIIWHDMMFCGKSVEDDKIIPLAYLLPRFTDEESIKDCISDWGHPERFTWDSPREEEYGDLQCLYDDAKVETIDELVKYLNEIEMTGNIYEDQ